MLIALLAVLLILKNFAGPLQQKRGSNGSNHQINNIPTTVKRQRVQVQWRRTVDEMMMNALQKQQSTALTSGADNVDEEEEGSTSVIVFKAGEKQCCHEIRERHVQVIGSAGTHDHGSSKVKLKNIVDYKWEVKNYPGHLIAVHIDGKHIAYVINVNNKVSRMEGMIRVVNTQTSQRALIKGMSGEVLDLQFAHIEDQRVLGSIDASSLYVHKIRVQDDTLCCLMLIKVEDPLTNYTPKYDKILWCPYIETPGEDDEAGDNHLVVWARGSMFQCFHVTALVREHPFTTVRTEDLNSGYLKFRDDSFTISWVTLSPDGSTLGVGSTDGMIRFYQVYMHEPEPRCLHQWKPHNGKPISSFFFLDNLCKKGAEAYWKYAITGANNNTEFKVWDCGTWQCLQTLKISAGGGGGTVGDAKKAALPHFIAEIDRTSSYLVLASREARTCYVIQIVNNNNNNNNGNGNQNSDECNGDATVSPAKEGATTTGDKVNHADNDSESQDDSVNSVPGGKMPMAYIKSISEFPLSSGILSFSIVDAAVRRYKCGNDNYLLWEELDDYDEETNSIYCVVLRMFIVQSKSMQECRILYQPTVTDHADVRSTLSSNENYSTANTSKDSDAPAPINSVSGTDQKQLGDITDLTAAVDIKRERPALKDAQTLEALLDSIAAAAADKITLQTSTTTSTTSAVTLTAVTSGGETSVKTEQSRDTSPVADMSVTAIGFPAQQVNLMTPDAFSATTTNDKTTPDCVSSEVLNTILMLASVTGQKTTAPLAAKSAPTESGVNLLNLMSNMLVEEEDQHKQKKFIAIDTNPGRNNAGEHLASGGSSPSREVQEIMSLQDYEKGSYSGDELLLLEEQQSDKTVAIVGDTCGGGTAAVAPVAVGTDLLLNDGVVLAAGQVAAASQATGREGSWPKIPNAVSTTTLATVSIGGGGPLNKHSVELQNAASLITQAVVAQATSAGGGSAANVVAAPSSSGTNHTNISTDLAEINMKMNQLMDLIKVQSMQINNLHNEIADMKKANPMASQKSMSEFSFKLEMQLSKLMEQYLKRYENEHKKKLATFMTGRDVQNRELRDSFIQIINQYMMTQFGEMVAKVIAIEMQRHLVPLLTAKIDHMQQAIQMDVAQKLTAFDLMLKDNIVQVCKSKNIIDAFGKSVLVGVQGSLQAAFIESMSSTLIPAYEKSSQHMFKQLHEAFSVGIKEFMEQFNTHVQHLQPMQNCTEEVIGKMSGFQQQLDAVLLKHRNAVKEMLLETRKDIKGVELLLSRQIPETIRNELRKYCDTQAVGLRSQTNTPAPMYDLKETVKLLLHQGQINKAFHQALLANDLNLVEFTLRLADPNAVFTPHCCLEQKVLLSLIQQISADMSNHNEVKQNYLAEALLAINGGDPITREHAPKVLQDLFRNCQIFLMNQPKSTQCSNVRMLMKAVQAVKDQF